MGASVASPVVEPARPRARGPLLRPIFVGLSLLAFPIGYVIGFIALALVYYLMVTPIGLVFRLLGRDPMHRTFDRSAASYWIRRPETPSAKRYFQQF